MSNTITFKYEIGQEVWFYDSDIHSIRKGTIRERTYINEKVRYFPFERDSARRGEGFSEKHIEVDHAKAWEAAINIITDDFDKRIKSLATLI